LLIDNAVFCVLHNQSICSNEVIMRLRSLRLAGFKSFVHPTTLTFKQDLTAVVGPNGCGKSNVIDAIRWVMGESSARQLRGEAMSDVIFAGTDWASQC
jgi:chromosome segregation protein